MVSKMALSHEKSASPCVFSFLAGLSTEAIYIGFKYVERL
jgi:hypothetical protein